MRRHVRDRGASLVEFALIVPLLTLFLFGIIQFGIAYDMKQSVNSAAREGARMASIPDEANVTYSSIRNRVDASFSGLGSEAIDEVTVVVVKASSPETTLRTCPASTGCTPTKSPCTGHPGETVVVTATKDHVITIPFFGTRDVQLIGRGEFRCEIDA